MYPSVFGVPSYFLMWGVAGVACVGLGTWIASRNGFLRGRSFVALALLVIPILLGSKLHYLLEATFFPFDDYFPIGRRTFLHGFRIPGGILLLAATTPLVCRFLALDRRRFIDTVIPMAALALVFIRIGCFLNGCCFGKLTGLPWGVSFPAGSLAYAYQLDHGWLSSSADWSLSVHPLQLYLCLAALAILVILVLAKGHGEPGMRQLAFYALFFGSTAALEPMRANFLTLNNILAPTAAIITAGWLIGYWVRARQTNDLLALSTEGIR
jgi:phosphatidylglycerol---prolipoprotein diacylglyceryl transferase